MKSFSVSLGGTEAPEQENSRLTGVTRPTPTPARYPSPDENLWRSFRRVPRFVWLLASALTLLFASLFWMLRLQSWRSPGEVGYEHQSDSTRSWWFAPVVFGEARSLPDISGRINGIAIQNTGKTSRIWIVAPGGYLAYSDDDGYCWVPYKYDPASGQFRPPANHPCPSQQSTGVLHWPELVPRAYAASEAAGPAIDVRPRQITFRAVELSPVQQSSPKTQSQSVVVTNNSRSIVRVSTKGFEGDERGSEHWAFSGQQKIQAGLLPTVGGVNAECNEVFIAIKNPLPSIGEEALRICKRLVIKVSIGR